MMRLLFNGGETFTSSGASGININGPGYIGSYGTGNAIVSTTGSFLNNSGPSTPNIKDWRIVNITANGPVGTSSDAIDLKGGFDQLTIDGVTTNNFFHGFNPAYVLLDTESGTHLFTNIAVLNSTFSNYLGIAVIGGAKYLAVMGSSFTPAVNSQYGTRLTPVYGSVYADNTCNCQNALHVDAKFEAPQPSPNYSGVASINPNNQVMYGVFSDNKLFNESNLAISDWAPGTQTPTPQVQYGSDFVIERNWYVYSQSSITPSGPMYGIAIEWNNIAVRDNVFDLSNYPNGPSNGAMRGVQITKDPSGVTPSNVWVYNNTYYSNYQSQSSPGAIAFYVDSNVTNGISIKNNLAYAPNDTLYAPTAVYVAPGSSATQSNNSTNSQMLSTDPGITCPSGCTSSGTFNPTAAKPLAGSYAIGAGASVPVWSDFFLTAWPPTWDVGAVHH